MPVAIACLSLLSCSSQPNAPLKAHSLPTRDATVITTAELYADYEVDEGWGVELTLNRDGQFIYIVNIGEPNGSDQITRCTGSADKATITHLFGLLSHADLVDETNAFNKALLAPRGVGGQMGRYAVIATNRNGHRLAPRTSEVLQQLLDDIRSVIAGVEQQVEAGLDVDCAPEAEQE